MNSATPTPPPAMTHRRAWITTSWDDGHPLDFRIAEMLARYGLRGTFYVPRDAPSGTMSPAQVRELSESFEIGAHTLSHAFLTSTEDATARREIADSRKWVEDVTGRPCRMFCPPAGKFAPRHLRWVEAAGYEGVRTVELLSLDRPRGWGKLKVMPTTIHAFPHGAATYTKNALRRGAARNLWLYVRHGWMNGSAAGWAELAAAAVRRATAAGGVFHLWGHSWELQETGQWARLEEVLRLLGGQVAQSAVATNGQLCSAA